MPQTPPTLDVATERETLHALATAPVASADELARNLSRIYHEIYERDLARYTGTRFQELAPLLMTDMFQLRCLLRDQIEDWHARGLMTVAVQHALRDALRVLRYATDMLGELNSGFETAGPADPVRRAFSEHAYNTFVHPRFDTGRNLDFKSGDVLLVRGMHHNSAAIARIGDIDSQFSHTAIIHIDAQNRAWVVESLIEDGAIITPLKDILDHQMARAVLLRHRDPEVAARASRLIYDHVRRSLSPGGKPILYDFSMELYGTKRLFCSKLIRIAYDDASAGQLRLPAFMTRFPESNRRFYKSIGVTATETFCPGDLEIEPAFDLVAEWQDYRHTSQVRHQDLIMSKMFEWMERHGHRFDEDFVIWLISHLGRFSTKLSKTAQDWIAGLFARVPPHMPRRTIATIVMLQKTAQPLLEDLQHKERLMVATDGRPLHPREIFDHLEAMRRNARGQLGYLVAPKKRR